MKDIVMITKSDKNKRTITITEYIGVKEKKEKYILEESCWGDCGIRKGELEKLIHKTFYSGSYHKGVELPYINGWDDKVYFFINKNKYDLNPTYYQDLVKNYKPE